MNTLTRLFHKLGVDRSISTSDAVESLLALYGQIQTHSETYGQRIPISLWREYESIDMLIAAGLTSVRDIGQQLHDARGREGMLQTYNEFVRRTLVVGAPQHLKEMWDGIGDWTGGA